MEVLERCFQNKPICSGWMLTRNRCTNVGYILTTPDYVDEKKVKGMLSEVKGFLGLVIVSDIFEGKEFYFSSTLPYKDILAWVVNTFRLEHQERHRKPGVSNKKKVGQYTLDGELVKIWDSCSDVAKETGWDQSHLCNAARGRNKSAHGYTWRYLDDEVE